MVVAVVEAVVEVIAGVEAVVLVVAIQFALVE